MHCSAYLSSYSLARVVYRPASSPRECDSRTPPHPAVHPLARQCRPRRSHPPLSGDQARQQRRRRWQNRGHAQVHAACARRVVPRGGRGGEVRRSRGRNHGSGASCPPLVGDYVRLTTRIPQMSDFREQLFPYLPAERFSTFSCGHVVPAEHVSTYAVSKGPTGVPFNFTFERRKDEKLVRPALRFSLHTGSCSHDTARRARPGHCQHRHHRAEGRRRLRAVVRLPPPRAGALGEERDDQAPQHEEAGAPPFPSCHFCQDVPG